MFRLVRDKFTLDFQKGNFGFSVENSTLGVRIER